jgi:glycine/D-amino acid oxidase-like deaminating enzyme
MNGITSFSMVFETSEEIEQPKVVFCADDANHCHLELYPRKTELYVCGIGGGKTLSPAELTKTKGAIAVDDDRIHAGVASLKHISSQFHKPTIAQACLRPCGPDALPTMCKLDKFANAFVCAGHNCWGILFCLISGQAMSELIVDGKSDCLKLAHFDIKRFH